MNPNRPFSMVEAPSFEFALDDERPRLLAHCYRMLGSLPDADDAVQETLLRAYRSRDSFEGRSSLGTWLHRIATRVCLDMLADQRRRQRAMEMGPVGNTESPLVEVAAECWLEPVPDALVLPPRAGPEERAEIRQRIRLAYIAALQHLPPRQRAALLLTDVVGFSAAEAADLLETSVPALNSALQRARATLARHAPSPAPGELTEEQLGLVERFVDAFERYDMEALTALLREDATMSMPPYSLWLRGPGDIAAWMTGRGAACRGSRLVPTHANGAPAFGQYKPNPETGRYEPWALVMLELGESRIEGLTFYLDTGRFFPRFGLPEFLPGSLPSNPESATDDFSRLLPSKGSTTRVWEE